MSETETTKVERTREFRQIRISQAVFEAIQAQTTPLVDTCDDVLRRVLNLPKREKKQRTK